jgi:hypothetical protein
MSVKGEKYKSMASKKKHEKTESASMRMKEYGTKKKVAKKTTKKKPAKRGLFGGM